jgi:hypothetical protein
MKQRTKQLFALVLALFAASVGVWAQFAPHSFYTSFPLPGRHWVSALGPYNEHMTRDAGGLFLAMLVVSAWAVASPRTEMMRLAGGMAGVRHPALRLPHVPPWHVRNG